MLHNSIQTAADCLPIDVEVILYKIYKYFDIYTVRTESLKEFCEFAEVEYRSLLSHTKTRWMSLFPALQRVIAMFDGLKSYFMSIEKCPRILNDFFSDGTSLLWLKFLADQLDVYDRTIRQMQSEELSLVEVSGLIENLCETLISRKANRFVTSSVRNILQEVEEEGLISKETFFATTSTTVLNT